MGPLRLGPAVSCGATREGLTQAALLWQEHTGPGSPLTPTEASEALLAGVLETLIVPFPHPLVFCRLSVSDGWQW